MNKAVVVLIFVVSALMLHSQTANAESVSPHVILAVDAGNGLRISGDPDAAQMRLQLLTAGGALVYDSSWRSGNVFDWPLQDGFGHGIAYGSYQMVVMSADVAGHSATRSATLRFEPGNVRIESDDVDVATSDHVPSLVRIGHTGALGELAVTQGDLSFRFGDFLAGKDVEVMRLTAGGNLDVAGVINARQGIRFPDGTIQQTAAVPSVVRLPSFRPTANIAGAGTTNTIAKWTDNAGTLGDAAISEAAGKVVVGVGAPNGGQIQILGGATQDIFSGMGVDVAAGPAMNFGYAGNSFGRSAGFFNMRPDVNAAAPNPSLRFLTGGQQRVIITNLGNVGIGTGFTPATAPVDKLEVAGNLKLSNIGRLIFPDSSFMSKAGATLDANNFNGAQSVTGNIFATGSISSNTVVHGDSVTADSGIASTTTVSAGTEFELGGMRILTQNANSSLFVGIGAGNVNGGTFNTFLGAYAGFNAASGSNNTFLGANSGIGTVTNSNTIVGNFASNAGSGCCNSVFGYDAGNTMTGSYNTFFGLGAGQGPNQMPSVNTGNSNAAFGDAAGFSLAGGGNNALVGTDAGYNITTGSSNVSVGDQSGESITTESNNTLLGATANVSAGVHDSTVIGYAAFAAQSNSLILGPANTTVGIGTTTPATTLEVRKDVEHDLGPVLTLRNASFAGGGISAIDMNTAANGNGIAGVRITAVDNNYSGDLVISTKTPGNGGNGTLAERLRVTNVGIVKINVPTATPAGTFLDVNGNVRLGGTVLINAPTTATPVGTFLDVNGNVRLGLTTGGSTPVCILNGVLSSCLASSIRYKSSVADYKGGLDVLRHLRPVTFRWKTDGHADFGLIAEEVERAEPLLSVYDEQGTVNGVKYDHIGVLLVNAVKEEAAALDQEREHTKRLESENEELRARLDRLEKIVDRLSHNN